MSWAYKKESEIDVSGSVVYHIQLKWLGPTSYFSTEHRHLGQSLCQQNYLLSLLQKHLYGSGKGSLSKQQNPWYKDCNTLSEWGSKQGRSAHHRPEVEAQTNWAAGFLDILCLWSYDSLTVSWNRFSDLKHHYKTFRRTVSGEGIFVDWVKLEDRPYCFATSDKWHFTIMRLSTLYQSASDVQSENASSSMKTKCWW